MNAHSLYFDTPESFSKDEISLAPVPEPATPAAEADSDTRVSRRGARRAKANRDADSHPARRPRRRNLQQSKAVPNDAYRDCLEQAEVCREQARVAAGLKRFAAARGLFATAISLCQRALGLREASTIEASTIEASPDASECLRQLTIEMSTYSELAKSMERPLRKESPLRSSNSAVASNRTVNG